jgi:NADH-quinone oxidoreductase subunit A
MTGLTSYILLFLGIGVFFVFIHLVMGKLIRPIRPSAEKLTIYECGEPTIGSAWIQFDLRFYVVALLFVIFDVEVVFFFPWAVVFGKANTLSNEAISAEVRSEISNELIRGQGPIDAVGARQLAWLSFWDILVFFGVLLVGFAYLWRRGDLDWVRSTLAEQAATRAEEDVLAVPDHGALVATAPK